MLKPSVHLVRRRVEKSRHRLLPARRFEDVQGPLRVDREILLWIHNRSRHGHLRGKMKNHLRPLHGLFYRGEIPHVAFHELHAIAVHLLEPAEILIDARASHVVEQHNVVSVAQKPIRQIRADESDSACYQYSHLDRSPVLLHRPLHKSVQRGRRIICAT